jgi:N-acetyl-anhydromuramyl-L-alanine amidase AmpD
MSRSIKYIVFHCTAGQSTQSTQSIKQFWANKLGWKSYGYHYLVNANGSIEHITPLNRTTNGVAGFNANSIHVCYKGGFRGRDTRTDAQKKALMDLAIQLKKAYPNAKLMGHRDFSKDLDGDGVIEPHEYSKLCPCFSVTKEYGHI